MRSERKKIIALLNERDYVGVASLNGEGVPVFRILLGLSYDMTELLCWRAVEAVGHLAAAVAVSEPGRVRNMVRRLVWTLSDECGGMAWTAPEMLAEMAVRNPVLCGDIPLIVVHLDEPPFRFGAVWSAGRLAETHRDDALTAQDDLVAALEHQDAQVRAAAVWALGRLRARGVDGALARMTGDEAPAKLYYAGDFHPNTVGGFAKQAVKAVSQ